MFRRNISPPSSGSKSRTQEKHASRTQLCSWTLSVVPSNNYNTQFRRPDSVPYSSETDRASPYRLTYIQGRRQGLARRKAWRQGPAPSIEPNQVSSTRKRRQNSFSETLLQIETGRWMMSISTIIVLPCIPSLQGFGSYRQ
jgi:hypothetical protein